MSGKLKGIYDALDHGNYKNACKLCVAFLQKQPSHSLARALHAVALERCGRRDEAIQLCQETVTAGMACDANSPAVLDEIGLSTLQVVFRRCRHLDAILQMYEEAWNKQKEVEEYGVLVFMAAVHTNGFAKAQQVAMTLYNKFKKSHYLLWVTAAILLQVRAGAPSKALGLAAVMLTKAPVNLEALQGKAFNRGQLYLFFLHLGALQLQEKQAEALELLETCTPLLKLPSDISALKVQLLWEAGRRKEAVLEARQQLVANPGSWAHAQDYARLVFDLPLEGDAKSPCERLRNPPKVASMEDVETQTTGDEVWNALLLFRHLQQVQEQGGATGGGSGVNRVAFLAELELRRCALALSEGEPSAGQEDLQVLQVFVQRFSGRAHCFFDLKPHLCYVPAAPQLSGEGPEFTVLAARMRRAFRASGGTAAEEVQEACRLLQSWQDLGGLEKGPDALLQLAVVAFMEADRCSQDGCQYLLDAVALAKLGLRAPQAFGFKVLLLLLFNRLHLPRLMWQLYSTMDIKNIQHESLSYLVFDALAMCPELREVCRSIQAFHEDLDKDGGDALSAAFQMPGILCRAPEYADGIMQISRSLMWGKAIVEETAADLAASSSWEQLAESCRQSRVLALVADQPLEHWAWRNQDRVLLNGLQPLPALTPRESMGLSPEEPLRQSPRWLTSFASSWGCPRQPRPAPREGCGAAERLLCEALDEAPAQLSLSARLLHVLQLALKGEEERVTESLGAAKAALQALKLPDLGTCAAEAAEASEEEALRKALRRFQQACGFTACELLAKRTEAWPEATASLEALTSAFGRVAARLAAFAPPPRGESGESGGSPKVWALGSSGVPVLTTLLSCLNLLLPVVLHLTNALPKSGKKAKAGDPLHDTRLALRDLLQALQRFLTEVPESAEASAAAAEVPGAGAVAEALKCVEDFHAQRRELEVAMLDAHQKQIKSLGELMAQRVQLLKSKAFKP